MMQVRSGGFRGTRDGTGRMILNLSPAFIKAAEAAFGSYAMRKMDFVGTQKRNVRVS
ncbi:MAG: hypothetical protein OJF52_002178 [Nitrospira sp.]|jgi:hypothetical protein|nr:MAG: hypothetical protein OJF52_002178 [Nitrospira sp.]